MISWHGWIVMALAHFIQSLVFVYTLVIIAAVVFSWLHLPYSRWLAPIRSVVESLTSPYLRLFRRFVPPIGGLDFSPLVALIALQLAGGAAARSATLI